MHGAALLALATACQPGGQDTAACLAGCELFNDGVSGCGISNYDCSALCAESARIAVGTGCEAASAAFWRCFAGSPPGAYCRGAVCEVERTALDSCVARAPSTDCLRACVACGDSSYGTCALGCARRDAHAHLLGCDAEYGAYYACRLRDGACAACLPETDAFTRCWSASCAADPERCPVTP